MDKTDINRTLGYLDDERNGAALYDAMAAAEKDERLAEVYRRFAAVERRHAEAWANRLKSDGAAVPAFRPSWRTRVLGWLARRLGPKFVLPTLVDTEKSAAGAYSRDANAAELVSDESSHARRLGQMAAGGESGMGGDQVARLEGRHRAGGGNALRAAVLGANDGLVSNLSLVMGIAGAVAENSGAHSGMILVTGMAGLLAGACSMALGEWLSVQSSRELYQRQIEIEKAEIASAPQEEAEELALIYQSRGLELEHARDLARSIMSNREGALATLTREELGINPEELGGSAHVAAITSFLLFAAGAIIPVIPFTFLHGVAAIAAAAAFSAVGLFAIGSAITLFTGKRPLWSGLRMVIIGLAAAALTFGIGRLVGVNLAG